MPRGIPNARPDQGPGIVDPEQPVDEISGDDPIFNQMGAKLGEHFDTFAPIEAPRFRPNVDVRLIPAMVEGKAKWSKAKAIAFLKAQPFLPVNIPLTHDELGRGGKFYELVGWNGWHYPVLKGRTMFVPLPIAEIIEQSAGFYHTVQAKTQRAFDTMLVTAERPEGGLYSDGSDPAYEELAARAGHPGYRPGYVD
jgi:hypothetical protein